MPKRLRSARIERQSRETRAAFEVDQARRGASQIRLADHAIGSLPGWRVEIMPCVAERPKTVRPFFLAADADRTIG